jgi:ribosomal protein S17E
MSLNDEIEQAHETHKHIRHTNDELKNKKAHLIDEFTDGMVDKYYQKLLGNFQTNINNVTKTTYGGKPYYLLDVNQYYIQDKFKDHVFDNPTYYWYFFKQQNVKQGMEVLLDSYSNIIQEPGRGSISNKIIERFNSEFKNKFKLNYRDAWYDDYPDGPNKTYRLYCESV